MNTLPIKGTEVLGVEAPGLTTLKTRPCSLEELQAAIVQTIEILNANAEDMSIEIKRLREELAGKEPRKWRASL